MRSGFQFITSLLVICVFFFMLLVPSAFAHARYLYTIGGEDYLFVVGSSGEPVYVDDKTGVDLRVMHPDSQDPYSSSAPGVEPVSGLEQTLKVEVSSGDYSKTFDFSPRFGEEGAYDAVFFPTSHGEYEYRVFGTIGSVPFDQTYTCTGEGEQSSISEEAKQISSDVVQKYSAGGFGCPRSREEVIVPPLAYDSDGSVQDEVSETSTNNSYMMYALFGVLGLLVIIVIYFFISSRRTRNK